MAHHKDWKKLLKADPTGWLLEPEDPGVRYLALRDLTDAGGNELSAAREKAYRDGPIGTILENMDPEGYWVTPGLGYGPKCRSTVWSLISLAQLGASIDDDERVAAACAYFLENGVSKGGQISPIGRPTGTAHCLQGNVLATLADMGCRDSRLDTAWEWMARAVTKEDLPVKINPDGLAPGEGVSGRFRYLHRYDGPVFACQTNKHLSCGWGGVCVMMAFSRLPVERRTGLIERAIQAGVDFFLDNEPAKAGFPGHRAGTPDPRWWQFKFPDFWPSDVLKLAEAFTTLGYGNDPRLADTLQLVRGKQDDNGRWALDYVDKTRKMWVKYGAQGKPNKWITLRAMRLLKRVGETG